MKTKILREVEIEVKTLRMVLPVNYEEEDIPNDTPGRYGEEWKLEVDIDTGRIAGWPQGREMDVYMKVVDGGCYYLFDSKGEEVALLESVEVPNGLIPGEFGDYVDFKINGHGYITNWPKVKDIDLDAFFEG